MEEKTFFILQCLAESDAPISDFPTHLNFTDLELLKYSHELTYKGLVQFNRNNYTFEITETGRQEFEKENLLKVAKAKKEELFSEKLQLEISDLRNRFFDYEETKRKTKWSFILSVIAVFLTLIGLLLQWKSKT